jgi:hypothetical protein
MPHFVRQGNLPSGQVVSRALRCKDSRGWRGRLPGLTATAQFAPGDDVTPPARRVAVILKFQTLPGPKFRARVTLRQVTVS